MATIAHLSHGNISLSEPFALEERKVHLESEQRRAQYFFLRLARAVTSMSRGVSDRNDDKISSLDYLIQDYHKCNDAHVRAL